MSAYLESMAYRRGAEKPWHGEGETVNATASLEEWLDLAGLNWKVVSQPISIQGANSSGDNYRAIMRDKDGEVYQIATTRYKPLQNADVLGFFRDFAESGQMQIETVGSLKRGAVVWALASIDKSFTLAGGDDVKGYVLLSNSHDGSMAVCAATTSVRVVCWNTLRAAIGARGQHAQFRMRHTRRFGREEQREALRLMKLAREEFDGLHETAQQLSEARVQPEQLIEWCYKLTDPSDSRELLTSDSAHQARPAAPQTGSLLDAMMAHHDGGAIRTDRGVELRDLNAAGRAILDAAMRSPGSDRDSARGTWWGALNGATYYADHAAKTRGNSSRLDSAWFGAGDRLKQQAAELAVQYATAAR